MNQHLEDAQYNIKQVSDITGLSKQVVRKWEERYGIVRPIRLDNGYRMYSHKELNTLLFVKSLIEKGQTVKQAAMIIEQQNLQPKVNSLYDEQIHQTELLNEHVLSLLYEGTNCHEENLNRILQQAYHLYGLEPFLQLIVIPFLKEVGKRWSNKSWGEYQEALSSMVVRDFLVQLRRNFKVNENAPLMLGACLPDEKHEIPLLIILLKSMLKGWRTVIIGPSPAPNAIQSTVKQLNPNVVALSATTMIPFEKNKGLLEELDEFAGHQSHIDFYIGGAGTHKFLKGKKLQYIKIVQDITEIL